MVELTSNGAGGDASGKFSSSAIWGRTAVARTGRAGSVVVGSGTATGGSRGAIKSTGSSGLSSNRTKIPPTPVDISAGPADDFLDRDTEFVDTGRTGWYRESGGNEMYVSCCGVTREKFCNLSKVASLFRDGGLLVSTKFDIEPEIGEISPCLVGSSVFISTSPSFFSSWGLRVRISVKLRRCDNIRTTSIGSPSAAAFFFSRAFTLAVVERTAVATFVIASFLAGLVELG